jgi:membrane fusion protein (multidrug efflux system)
MNKIIKVVCVIIAISLAFVYIGCGKNSESKPKNPKDTAVAVPVEVKNVTKGTVSAFFSGSATLEAEGDAVVVARVSGVMKEILVEEGGYVQAGQVLAKLDDEKPSVKLAQEEANLRKIENDFKRNEELFSKKLISDEIYQRSKSEYESQKASFNLAKLEFDYTSIRAPISGVISERKIKVGNMILANQPTFRITDFDPLLALIHVPEREISKLRVGQSAVLKVDAVSNVEFFGKIDRISPIVDPSTGTIKVTVEVRDPSRILRPGMFGRVNIVYDVHLNTLIVPKESILAEDSESAVFVVRDSVAYRQIVKTGYANTTHIEIVSGVNFGDTVVTTGQGSLKDSSKVEIVSR